MLHHLVIYVGTCVLCIFILYRCIEAHKWTSWISLRVNFITRKSLFHNSSLSPYNLVNFQFLIIFEKISHLNLVQFIYIFISLFNFNSTLSTILSLPFLSWPLPLMDEPPNPMGPTHHHPQLLHHDVVVTALHLLILISNFQRKKIKIKILFAFVLPWFK